MDLKQQFKMKRTTYHFNLRSVIKITFVFLFVTGYTIPLIAQQKAQLQELLKKAETDYPLLKSKVFDAQAAQKGINASKSTLIPTLDASYQINYSTYNNITGMSYPQFLVPISGPPSTDNNYNGVFGSATSLLLNWQPVTFGQRQAQVNYSKANYNSAEADTKNEIFQHKIKVINAYLDALVASELVKVYQKNQARTETNLAAIKSLVVNGIKPGVDTSLFKAEISKAKIDLLNSLKYRQQTLIILSQFTNSDNIIVNDSSYFNNLPSLSITPDSVKHPLLSLYNSNIALSNAKKKMINRTMLPVLNIWGTTYARGSGIQYNGAVNSSDGLSFQRYNYGLGMQLSVPLLAFGRIRPQLLQQEFVIKSSQEKLNDLNLQLKKQMEIADENFSSALNIAKENPLFYESAILSYNALTSRYQSGLTNYADLIQAQYILTKAEAENKTTYVGVWKALLYKAAVSGDLNLFLNQIK